MYSSQTQLFLDMSSMNSVDEVLRELRTGVCGVLSSH